MTRPIQVLLALAPSVARVFAAVADAMEDGEIDAAEAERLGAELARQAGDLEINGRNVLREPALQMILGGLGRVARQVVIALRA